MVSWNPAAILVNRGNLLTAHRAVIGPKSCSLFGNHHLITALEVAGTKMYVLIHGSYLLGMPGAVLFGAVVLGLSSQRCRWNAARMSSLRLRGEVKTSEGQSHQQP